MSSDPRVEIPDRFRLGDYFVPRDRYVDPEFQFFEDRRQHDGWGCCCHRIFETSRR